MTTPLRPPKDGIRAMPPGSLQGDGKTLTGRLATGWAEIESVAEGHFMERFAPGAFRKTFTENRDNIKVLFQHGRDMSVGQQPIAVLEDVGEDADGAYYRAELLDGVPPLILDGLRRGVYGSSHTFRVVREDWEPRPKGGSHNPKKLPERIVREAHVWEFGPVTWPAYAGQALARSMSDEFQLATLTEDPEHLRNLVNYIDPDAPSVGAAAEPHPEPERREAVAPPTTPKKEPTPVDITQYRTRDEMAARRRELDAEITRMAELPGVLADPDQADWDSKTEERTALDAAITAWDARVAVAERIAAEKPENTVAYTPPNVFARKSESDIFDPAVQEPYRYRSTDQWAGAQRDNAMRIIESTTFVGKGHIDQERAREDVQHVLDHADTRDKQAARRVQSTQSPIYLRAFNKMAAGQPLTAEEERGTAMVVTTDGNGGFAVPFAFDPTWLHTGAWTWVNGIRANARVVQIVGTDTWHGTTVGSVTATRGAEATEQAEQGPTLTRPEILATRVSAFVGYSIEMDQDVPGLGAELASLIGEAKDNEEENIFTNGVGAAHSCLGILPVHGTAGIYTNIDLITAHTLAAADAYAVEAALPIRHRKNAAWYLARPMIRRFQALETTGGQLFGGQNYASVGYPQNSIVGATGLELLRYPIVECPSMTYDITVDDTPLGLLADLKASYVIVDRIGMSVEFIPHLFHVDGKLPIGRRGLYALWRNGAEIVNVDGGRSLTVLNA